MNEAKVYADNYGETFTEERHFLDFLTSRGSSAWWQKETTQDIQFRAMTYEIQKIGVNINQIAHRVNSTDTIYARDIEELKEGLARIWQLQRSNLLSLR